MKIIVEHLEPEISEWTECEYSHMLEWAGYEHLVLSHVHLKHPLLDRVQWTPLHIQDPLFEKEFGIGPDDVLLLDPAAEKPLTHHDTSTKKALLFGGILGQHPPIDRTAELRKQGFETRHLGPVQLPTDHAVIAALEIARGTELDDIPHVDYPTIQLNKHESVELPYRYYARDGKPVIAPGLLEHIVKSHDEPLYAL